MDAMKQPGRSGNINTGLKSMFSRHLVTRRNPTLELPPPPPSPVTMSNETQDQATSQRYCLSSIFLLLLFLLVLLSFLS